MNNQNRFGLKEMIWELMLCFLVLVCLITSSCTSPVTEQAPAESTANGTAAAEDDLDEVAGGPYLHKILSASSPDGLNWTYDSGIRLDHASVPCAISDGKRIVLYYVDANRGPGQPESISCAISSDGMNFLRQPFRIEGCVTGKALDPSILRDASGQYRLYYLASNATGDPAAEIGEHQIHLATSEDGVSFRYERSVFSYPDLVDPDVFVFNGMWLMYAFSRNQTIIATSDDGRSFDYLQPLDPRGWGTVAPIQLTDGRLRLYAFQQGKGAGNAIHTFVSTDGLKWEEEPGDRLIASSDQQITDPFVVHWKGGYKMFFKVEKRGVQGAESQQPDGPWNHRVMLATSSDGLSWAVSDQLVIEQCSVPELFLGPDGLPILLFVDASGQTNPGELGAMSKQGDGSWLRRRTNLFGADPNVVLLKDGSYRSYTKDRNGSILVFSSVDGLDWWLSGEAFQDDRYPQATDPDVFETPSGWVMLVSLGPQLLRCTSADGIRFVAGQTIDIGGSVSDTVPVENGWRTFFHVNATQQTGGKMIIRSAFTADGLNWRIEAGDRVIPPSNGPAELGVADPAPLQLRDGTWLMAIKSFIR